MRSFFPSLFCWLILSIGATAQPNWVDQVYTIETVKDIPYGEALDYAGTSRTLTLDLAYPTNDQPPVCGRPLMLIIHGGAWLGGDKALGYPALLLEDFAQRGYVTASIRYRLGMFQTEKEINCNISGINGLQWNCLNMSDSLEWVRAWYRAVQDGKGALRFLVDQHEELQIDRRNVFVVGESAGAFTALGVVYLDQEEEKPAACDSIASVLLPNPIYEQPCVINPGFAADLDSMDLRRPDLGSIHGNLHLNVDSFRIRACGDIYGGLFQDLFSKRASGAIPALYLYHQPADLIVPINYNHILAGFSACASSIGGCQSLYGRPHTSGSSSVVGLLQSLQDDGLETPDYFYDKSTNNASCLEQILNPSTGGHSFDNYTLRTGNMAAFFAEKMDVSGFCLSSEAKVEIPTSGQLSVHPNPTTGILSLPPTSVGALATLYSSQGSIILESRIDSGLQMNLDHLPPGLYYLRLILGERLQTTSIVKL